MTLHPIPFHTIPFHLVPFHLVPFHHIASHSIPSHPDCVLFLLLAGGSASPPPPPLPPPSGLGSVSQVRSASMTMMTIDCWVKLPSSQEAIGRDHRDRLAGWWLGCDEKNTTRGGGAELPSAEKGPRQEHGRAGRGQRTAGGECGAKACTPKRGMNRHRGSVVNKSRVKNGL